MPLKTYILNDKGYSLLFVLILIAVLSITGVSIMGVTANNVKITAVERDHQAVFYIAEAGMTLKMEEFKDVVMETYQDPSSINSALFFSKLENKLVGLGETINSFEPTFGELPEAQITVSNPALTEDVNTRTYELISKGKIGDRTRTVVKTLDVTWHDKDLIIEDGVLSPYALFASESIYLGGSAEVTGNVGTGASTITGANRINGRVDYNVTDTLVLPDFPDDLEDKNISLTGNQLISFEDDGLDFARYNSITINSNEKLTVNVGDEPRELQVGTFTMNSSGTNTSEIELVGTGSLTIFVEGDLILDGGKMTPVVSDRLRVAFIVAGNVTLSPNGSHDDVRAFIFAPNSTINIRGNSAIIGSLIAKKIDMRGNTSSYIPLHLSDVGPVFSEVGRIGEGPATLDDLLPHVTPLQER